MSEGRKDTALGLGERLRSARKARALTLEQAANALHLEESVLEALEEDRFSSLGAPVFVRGHLRSYARLLELSEESVLDAYRSADPSSQSLPRVARNLEKPVRQSPGPWVFAGFLVFLLFAFVLTYVAQDKPPAAPTPVSQPLTEIPLEPQGPWPAPAIEPAAPATGASPAGEPAAPPADAPSVPPADAGAVVPTVPATDPAATPATPSAPLPTGAVPAANPSTAASAT